MAHSSTKWLARAICPMRSMKWTFVVASTAAVTHAAIDRTPTAHTSRAAIAPWRMYVR